MERTTAQNKTRKAILGVYLLIYLVAATIIVASTDVISAWQAIAAGLLYLISHALRAMRLASLSVDLLGTSARSTAALHFMTAPFALLMPLKSGELVRLFALWKMSGNAVYSIVVLLIDRMYDSLFLFPILILLTMQGGAPTTLVIFTLMVATIPLAVVVIGPKLLTELQRYVVASQNSPVTLETLARIDAIRRLVTHAAEVARRQAPHLCLVSFLIWLCELLVCVILVNGAVAVLGSALDLLGARLITSWASDNIGTLITTALTITLTAQLLPWPAMVMVYLDRLKHEPQRHPAMDQTKREVIT